MSKSRRGFASMNKDKVREIASKGGKTAHERGVAHEFTSEEAREAGRKGGEITALDRDHMREIASKGGSAASQNRKAIKIVVDWTEGYGPQSEDATHE